MIPADASEGCDQLKLTSKLSCSVPASTEARVETLNPAKPF